jgi:hypothetical protein
MFKEMRLKLINEIDERAKHLARSFVDGEQITENLLKTIIELYDSAQIEKDIIDDNFEVAYHTPVTGELELLIARILFHYSKSKELGWKIFLRRQVQKTAPDIRIEINNKTIAIIEIKAKGGWIQPFLSPERYANDKVKFNLDNSFNPDSLILRQKNQLDKYKTTFEINKSNIYFFLPTLALVHRKKYETSIDEYYEYFTKTSGLPKNNYILLSENRRLDLAYKPNLDQLQPTNNFEWMLKDLFEIK